MLSNDPSDHVNLLQLRCQFQLDFRNLLPRIKYTGFYEEKLRSPNFKIDQKKNPLTEQIDLHANADVMGYSCIESAVNRYENARQ